ILTAQLRGKCFQERLRLSDGKAGAQPPHGSRDDSESSPRGRRPRRAVEARAQPHVYVADEGAAGVPEVRRHHADHGVEVAIDADLLAEGFRITAEGSPPE